MHYALAIDTITLFSKIELRRPGAANFADIIKTAKLIKATFKKSIKVETTTNYLYFPIENC